MSTSPGILTTSAGNPDISGGGTFAQPYQPPQPATGSAPKKGGFWNILRNKIIPAIGPVASAIGAAYGNTGGVEMEQLQRQNARQAAFDAPQLAALQEQADEAPLRRQKLQQDLQAGQDEAEIRKRQLAQPVAGSPEWFAQLEAQKNATAPQFEGKSSPTGPDQLFRYDASGSARPVTTPGLVPNKDAAGNVPQALQDLMGGGTPAPSDLPSPPQVEGQTPVFAKDSGTQRVGDWVVRNGEWVKPVFDGKTNEFKGYQTATGFINASDVPPEIPPNAATSGAPASAPAPSVPSAPPAKPGFVGPPALAPRTTTREGTSQQIEKDANNNLVTVTKPSKTTTTSTRGVPGAPQSTATPGAPAQSTAPVTPQPQAPVGSGGGGGMGRAKPVLGPDGTQLHAPLSQAAKTSLFSVTATQGLIDNILPELQKVGASNTLWDSAQQRAAWAQYTKLGIDPANVDPNSVASMLSNVNPTLAKLIPTIAMLRIVGSQAYLRGIRNFNFIAQIQQHLPDPEKDTPQNMMAKLQALQQNLPLLKNAIYQSEGMTPPAAGPGTGKPNLASGGGSITNASDYLKKLGLTPTTQPAK